MLDLRSVYFGLDDSWWKQIIDRPYHKHGPEVFDKGLHGHATEPGFFEGIRAASEEALLHIDQEPSVEIYKKIHKEACGHFNRKDTASKVLIEGKDAGQFKRGSLWSVRFDLIGHDYRYGYWLILHSPEIYAKEGLAKLERCYPGISTDTTSKEQLANRIKYKQIQWENRMARVTEEIATLSKDLGLPKPLAKIKWNDWYEDRKDTLQLYYKNLTPEQLEKGVQYLFDRFNKKIQDQTLIRQTIAELFQHLEWLHPFSDGQGRTDLIHQATLLTKYGLHPPILRRPYDSSILPLDEWDAKLRQGLNNWKKEHESNRSRA